MKKLFFYFSLLIASKFSFAQTYTVPNAQVQPAWVFPIWFEDGEGAKDTIYFCYDFNANDNYPNTDTIFGEKLVYKDSSKFWVGIWGDSSNLTFRTYVSNNPFSELFFHKGQYPLKITWDDTIFYSSAIPYPDLSPLPRARIAAICSDAFGNCPSDVELSITATSSPFFPFPLIDSAIFNGFSTVYVGNTLGEFTIQLKPFDSPIVDAVVQLNSNPISAYPTITQKGIWIEPVDKVLKLTVFNSIGQLINQASVTPVYSKAYFDLSSYSGGIYFVTIQSLNLFRTFKILKQ